VALTARHGYGGLSVGDVALMRIEQDFGTPAYILDEADVRERCAAYATAFGARTWSTRPRRSPAAACCAGSTRPAWVLPSTPRPVEPRPVGRLPAERIVVHGDVEVRGAGRWSSSRARHRPSGPNRAAVATGRDAADPAHQLGFAATAGLPAGDDDRFGAAGRRRRTHPIVAVAARMKRTHGVRITELNLGGGFAVAQTADDITLAVDPFAAPDAPRPRPRVRAPGHRRSPAVGHPGRAIVARAGSPSTG